MNKHPALVKLSESLLAEAARWCAKMANEACPEDTQAFADWLKMDPKNGKAYEQIRQALEVSEAAALHPEMQALRREALLLRPQKWKRLPMFAAVAATLLLFISGAAVWLHLPPPGVMDGSELAPARRLQTAIGEKLRVPLADGSIVTLNTNTRLLVQYTQAQRSVTLLSGQAFFQVAKNKVRPFVVTAGNRQVVAVGTEFEVKMENADFRVALLEGKVKVRNAALIASAHKAGAVADEAILLPGECIYGKASGAMTKSAANVADMVSWLSGRVRFQATPLGAAAAEMNRYSRDTIVIADPAISSIRLSGTFVTGQSASFVASVTALLPIKPEYHGHIILLKRAG